MNRYVLAAAANADLNSIWDYVARDSVDAADRLVDQLFNAFELLANSPQIGHSRDDLTVAPVLFWPVGSYLVIYRGRVEHIEIVAITRGGRDIPSFLEHRAT